MGKPREDRSPTDSGEICSSGFGRSSAGVPTKPSRTGKASFSWVLAYVSIVCSYHFHSPVTEGTASLCGPSSRHRAPGPAIRLPSCLWSKASTGHHCYQIQKATHWSPQSLSVQHSRECRKAQASDSWANTHSFSVVSCLPQTWNSSPQAQDPEDPQSVPTLPLSTEDCVRADIPTSTATWQ